MPLTRGLYAIVDTADLPLVNKYYWRAVDSAHITYAVARRQTDHKVTTIRMHRLIAATPPHKACHHRNGDSLDNRRINLHNMDPLEHDLLHALIRITKKTEGIPTI